MSDIVGIVNDIIGVVNDIIGDANDITVCLTVVCCNEAYLIKYRSLSGIEE